MTKREVEKYIKDKKLFDCPEVKRLGRGNNADVFLIKDKGKQFTFRVGRKGKEIKDKFINHYIALKFLEEENIKFAPRATLYDKKNTVLITTYAPGKPITEKGFTKKELGLFIEQLVKLYSIKFSQYKKFTKQSRIKLIMPETPVSGFKKYGVKRFNYLKKICRDREIVDWIKPRLEENKKYIESVKWSNSNLIFTHGDLTGANILKHKNKIYFIDWERAGFRYSNNFSLSYKFIHFEFFFDHREEIMEKFARYKKISLNKLREAVIMGMLGVKLNDIIWSAIMYAELYKQKERGWKKYRQMTHKRIREYGNLE